jgi:hypothetical protein
MSSWDDSAFLQYSKIIKIAKQHNIK